MLYITYVYRALVLVKGKERCARTYSGQNRESDRCLIFKWCHRNWLQVCIQVFVFDSREIHHTKSKFPSRQCFYGRLILLLKSRIFADKDGNETVPTTEIGRLFERRTLRQRNTSISWKRNLISRKRTFIFIRGKYRCCQLEKYIHYVFSKCETKSGSEENKPPSERGAMISRES